MFAKHGSRWVWAALTMVVALGIAPSASASASDAPLAPLRDWAHDVNAGVGKDRVSDRWLQAQARRLPALARKSAAALRDAQPAVRVQELRRTDRTFATALDPIASRLTPVQAFFLFTDEQAALEQFAQLAGLPIAPTGRPVYSPADAGAPTATWQPQDTDGDGVADAVDIDDDANGVPDATDPSDAGWGIPDVLQAREDQDDDSDENGSGGAITTANAPCFAETERIPDYRTVAAAAADEQARGCPRASLPADPAAGRAPKSNGGQGADWDGTLGDPQTMTGLDDIAPVADPATVPDCPTKIKPGDQDGDGLPDADEVTPYAGGHFDVHGSFVPKMIVTDPCDPNTDADATPVDVPGRGTITFELNDAQERLGGSDPSARDTDDDGISDVEERNRWSTKATDADTDRDGLGDRAELTDSTAGTVDPKPDATSPTTADTDGDTITDGDERRGGTNPTVADLPGFDVGLTPNASVTVSVGAVTSTLQQSGQSASSYVDADTEALVRSRDDLVRDAIAACASGDPCGVKIPLPAASAGETITRTSQTTFTADSQRAAQQDYQRLGRVKSAPDTGTLATTVDVVNRSSVPLSVSGLRLVATALCHPVPSRSTGRPTGCADPARVTTVGTLRPRDDTGSFGTPLAPRETRTVAFTAGDVPSDVLAGLLANPGNLQFTPVGYELRAGDRSYTNAVAAALRDRDAALTVDYDNGQVERYLVAVNVARDWGSDAAVPATAPVGAILARLGISHQLTGTELTKVRDLRAVDLPSDVAASHVVGGAWAVVGTGSGLTRGTPFDGLPLRPGDHLAMSYLADADGDRLYDREERAYGTSDTSRDSDGDAVRDASTDSDYFEARVGWKVPYPDEAHAFAAWSSPMSCDSDGDGSPDGPGLGASPPGACPKSQYPSEQVRKTDAANADTNDNGVPDGTDPRPLESGRPDRGRSWTGEEICPKGAEVYHGGCLLGKDDEIAPPALHLCGTGATAEGCGDGYYRVTWDISWEGCHTDTFPTDPTVDDSTIGRFSIATQGGAAPTSWLHAGLEASERGRQGPHDYELAIHVYGDAPGTRLSYRHLVRGGGGNQGCPALVRNLTFEPINRAAYLAEPSRAGFAAIAIPGRDLYAERNVTPNGPQGVRIDEAKPSFPGDDGWNLGFQGPGVVELPAGAYRAAFAVRKLNTDASSDPTLTLAANTSPGSPAPVKEAGTQNGSLGLPALYGGNATVLAGAHVRPADLDADKADSVDVLFEHRNKVEQLSLTGATLKGTTPVAVDGVSIDRMPTLRGYATKNGDYSALGFSAQSAGDRMSDACAQTYPVVPYYESKVYRVGVAWWNVQGTQHPVSFHNGPSGICSAAVKTAGRAAQWAAEVTYNKGDFGCDSRLDLDLRRSGEGDAVHYLPSGYRGYKTSNETSATTTTVDAVGQAEGTYPNPFDTRTCAPVVVRSLMLFNRLQSLPPVPSG